MLLACSFGRRGMGLGCKTKSGAEALTWTDYGTTSSCTRTLLPTVSA
jgi:hypothetical protein